MLHYYITIYTTECINNNIRKQNILFNGTYRKQISAKLHNADILILSRVLKLSYVPLCHSSLSRTIISTKCSLHVLHWKALLIFEHISCLTLSLDPQSWGTPLRTRRILDILYSAQHGNQHKDAFASIIYHDPCC